MDLYRFVALLRRLSEMDAQLVRPGAGVFRCVDGPLRRHPIPPKNVVSHLQQEFHQRFLRMQPVFSFLPDDRPRCVEQLGGDFLVSMRR